MSNPKTWLITGVAGFIGSNLLETLLLLNQRVIGLDNFSTGFQENLDDVRALVSKKQWDQFSFIKGDIRHIQDCRAACKNVDIVLHEAALGSVPRSIEDPINTSSVNIEGFLNMLVAAKDMQVKKFIYAASSSTYGDYKDLPKVENKIGRPLSPYAVTKYANELYADVFLNIYGLNTIGLRYFNVFGKRQNPNGSYAAVIPKWVNAVMNSMEVIINGDGKTSRDFCYIENVVQLNLLAALHSTADVRKERVFNCAVGESTDLITLYGYILELVSDQKKIYSRLPKFKEERSGDIRHSLADISLARQVYGYSPTHTLYQGLKEYIGSL